MTIRELFAKKILKLRKPLFLSKDFEISKVVRMFASGESHLGVVCKSKSESEMLMDLSQRVFENPFYRASVEEEINPVGCLSFENVLECILNIKILDEGDREEVQNKLLYQKCIRPRDTFEDFALRYSDKAKLRKQFLTQ